MTRFTVGVDEEHVDALDAVAEQLRSQGIQVEHVHPVLGLIEVSAGVEDVPRIEAVEGVEEVAESDETYQLPPPDSPIQ